MGPSSYPGCVTNVVSSFRSASPARQKTNFPTKPDTPRSSEPNLIAKLRIQFADFPYLH